MCEQQNLNNYFKERWTNLDDNKLLSNKYNISIIIIKLYLL